MKVDYVNPFLNGILNVLATMAMIEAVPGKPYLKTGETAKGEVTGLIGLASPELKGSLAINFTKGAILRIAEAMLGEHLTEIDATALDVAGEITNMVTGGAKRELSEKGYKFDMALPTIVNGIEHCISHGTKAPTIVVPFTIESAGEFYVEVSFEER
ncbi:MAG: chemotaxis protein CheX [Myxococcales bacterium]|nr:chemotaxis protein CheX [Myxococcales bacterium]